MKNWGLVVIVFYAIIVLILLLPAVPLGVALSTGIDNGTILRHWALWACAAVVIAGEVLLLWLSVDTSHKRLKPRTHILFSVGSAALFMTILTVGVVLCIAIAINGDSGLPNRAKPWAQILEVVSAFAIPWLVWSVVFYRLWKDAGDPITRAVAWLFRGSVLELLVAVPAHVISRRRDDCCAPVFSGVGISCGIAIMMLSFGPSIILLFKKRMQKHQEQTIGSVA